MNKQERGWFDYLTEMRTALYRENDRNASNIWDALTGYSDQAHFIYELLQNADDAGAQNVNFELKDDKLIFLHDGTKRFSISDPAHEKENVVKGQLGDINSITNIGRSSKNKDEDCNSIGKFGIGFKSVFTYTDRPEIYDDNMQFCIENYVIPRLLKEDYPGRDQGTTVFIFPFRKGKDKNSVDDILKKFKNLILPTMFLHNLKKITWKYGKISTGSYTHNTTKTMEMNDEYKTRIEIVSINNVIDQSPDNKSFILVSRSIAQKNNLRYAIGFGLGDNNKIQPINNSTVFCYFPTKVVANLRFIIHAPFILTHERAILSEDKKHLNHNQELLNYLAQLLADSLKILVKLGEEGKYKYLDDDFILKQIVPLQPPECNYEHLSLEKFYSAPLSAFQTEKVIPCSTGYCAKDHAYPMEYQHMRTFDDSDLQAFTGDSEAHWIFKGFAINSDTDNTIRTYVRNIAKNDREVRAQDVIEKAQGRFIEEKFGEAKFDWLNHFYKWIAENFSTQGLRNTEYSPLLLNQQGNATEYKQRRNGTTNLFLPIIGEWTEIGFNVVHPTLHELDGVKLLEKKYDMHEPKVRDIIDFLTVQIKVQGQTEQSDKYIKKLLKLACDGNTTKDDRLYLIAKLKDPSVGKFKNQETPARYIPAIDLYHSNDELNVFLGDRSCKWFIDESYYSVHEDARKLLTEVGVSEILHVHEMVESFCEEDRRGIPREQMNRLPTYIQDVISRLDTEAREVDPYYVYRRSLSATIPFIPGINEKIELILQRENGEEELKKYSKQIWDILLKIATCDRGSFTDKFMGIYVYKIWHRNEETATFTSPLLENLRNKSWIYATSGEFKKPAEIKSSELLSEYMQSEYAELVCHLLEIPIVNDETTRQAIDALPEKEQKALEFGKLCQDAGITNADDIKRALELLRNAKEMETSRPENGTHQNDNPDESDTPASLENQDTDDDIMHPRTVDYSKKIQALRDKMEKTEAEFERADELQKKAESAKEYTYLWLKTRIELEIEANGEGSDSPQKTATVSFAKIEKEQNSFNTFILSSPSAAIPQWFEDEINQPLTLEIPGRNTIRTVIENMSIDGFRLRARIVILPGMEHIDYSEVIRATTAATKPTFLLKSLYDGFNSLNLGDDYDLKANLSKNIKFVFGPPGTGKTTYLARETLIPLARSTEAPHVLVLTPTNKAADVLVDRIIEEMGADKSYEKWLFRFGHTLDDKLQGTPVDCGKSVKLEAGKPAVVVTTISRFPYDEFLPEDAEKVAISSVNWDYIVIDEASMISLMQILYPLYRTRNAKFIIAGDPMQIEPVILSTLAKEKSNIYAMVGLTNFANIQTSPHAYEVVRLFTQYRSIPAIGKIFSQFAYSGLLEHNRKNSDIQPLVLEGIPEIRPLTAIRFFVGAYENIYRVQRLAQSSSYHIYAALFAFEYICKIAEGLARANRENFRIGIISPYRAQAEIIDRLLKKQQLQKGIKVCAGTIHGFQGDECEMILAMLNPPRGMGRYGSGFINNRNILNVAISRARDYLIVMAPSEKDTRGNQNTKKIEFLTGPNEILGLMRKNSECFIEYEASDLEEQIWHDRDYIDRNTYPTGHQAVNVYQKPEKRFEIRTGSDAIDIQFHDRVESVQPGFVSGLEREEKAAEAEETERRNFIVPEGFHRPEPNENIPLEKGYYIIGSLDTPCYHKSADELIDMSKVVAIED